MIAIVCQQNYLFDDCESHFFEGRKNQYFWSDKTLITHVFRVKRFLFGHWFEEGSFLKFSMNFGNNYLFFTLLLVSEFLLIFDFILKFKDILQSNLLAFLILFLLFESLIVEEDLTAFLNNMIERVNEICLSHSFQFIKTTILSDHVTIRPQHREIL